MTLTLCLLAFLLLARYAPSLPARTTALLAHLLAEPSARTRAVVTPDETAQHARLIALYAAATTTTTED